MTLRERLPFITLITLSVALIIGLVELVPRLHRTELLLTLQETEDVSETLVSARIDGDVTYPGLYELDTGTSIGQLMQRAGCDDLSHAIAIIVGESDEVVSPQLIDLNRADVWLLEALPGIGPTRAEAIVQYRSCHGGFACVEQVTRVDGISDSTLEQISPFVTVTAQ